MKSSIILPEEELAAKHDSQAEWVEPMLATLTDDYFSDKDWLYERKLDGVRCLVFKKGREVRLMSRNKKLQNNIYPEIVDYFLAMDEDFIADGEIVAFDNKTTSFSFLQNRMNVQSPSADLIRRFPVQYYLFDLLYYDHADLTGLPLVKRKELLKKAIAFQDPVFYCEHRMEHGEQFLKEACKHGWEGLIAKDSNSKYFEGRSKKWLKFKCSMQQELVIGGFTKPQGERQGFGALLVGYYDKGKLKYAGKVGTGFNNAQLREIHSKLKANEIQNSPFTNSIKGSGLHWTSPELVAEVAFTEWTKANRLRHPRFLGLRNDKAASEVVKE